MISRWMLNPGGRCHLGISRKMSDDRKVHPIKNPLYVFANAITTKIIHYYYGHKEFDLKEIETILPDLVSTIAKKMYKRSFEELEGLMTNECSDSIKQSSNKDTKLWRKLMDTDSIFCMPLLMIDFFNQPVTIHMTCTAASLPDSVDVNFKPEFFPKMTVARLYFQLPLGAEEQNWIITKLPAPIQVSI